LIHHKKLQKCACRYNARTAYARTCAVMSMIGYVLGLGDRHGENILFDSTNGDTVHVDFNCLFNRVLLIIIIMLLIMLDIFNTLQPQRL
jgi:hypothetical protein